MMDDGFEKMGAIFSRIIIKHSEFAEWDKYRKNVSFKNKEFSFTILSYEDTILPVHYLFKKSFQPTLVYLCATRF